MNKSPRSFTFAIPALISLGIIMIATGLGVWQAAALHTTYSLTEFLATNDSSLKDDATLRKRFKLNDSPWMFVVAERNNGWMSKDAMNDLVHATEQLGKLKGIKSVASLGTLETIVREHGQIKLGRFAINSESILKAGVVVPVMISTDGHWAAMLVECEMMKAETLLKTKAEIENSLSKNLAAEQIRIGGVAIMQAELTSVLSSEIVTLGTLGAVAATLALVILFSGFTAILIASATCFTSNAIILGSMATMGKTLGVLSLSLPILIAVQTLSLTVHILFAYIETRKTESRSSALLASFKRLLLPNFLVSLATGVGFLTLATSNVIAMREFGLTVALASMALWIITTLTIYPLLAFVPEPQLRRFVQGRARWSLWLMKHRVFVLSAFAVSAFFSIATGMSVNYSHRLFDDLGSKNTTSIAAKIVDSNLGGLVPVEIELALPLESWLEPENRKRLEDISRLIRKLPVVGSVISPIDLFDFAGAKSSDSASIAELTTLFELAPQNPLKNFLRDGGRSARLSIHLRDFPSDEVETGIQEITRSIASISPNSQTKMGGWGSYIHRMNRELSQSLIKGFWEALGVIFILLIVVFRSIRWAVVSLIPSVLPPLFLIAAASAFQIEMKPGLAIVFAIALGFAFINTIYLMKRLRDFALKTPSGLVTARVVERAFWHESQSCVLSSLTLLIGFTTLCFSEFGVTRSFGMAMVFSMIVGILGDLVLLPALLRQFPDFLNPRRRVFMRLKYSTLRASCFLLLIILGNADLSAATRTEPASDESLQVFANAAAKLLIARDESTEIELTNVDPDGDSEVRKIELSRLTVKSGKSGQQKVVARIIEPKSLKGTSVLTVTNGETQSRWIYIPASKQVRRILGGEESSAPILGSELSTEDLDLSQIDGARSRIVSRKNGILKIESQISKKESAYSKCVANFDASTRLLNDAECFDRKGKPFKRISISSYRKINGTTSRPVEMKVENLQTKRFTKIVFNDQKINSGLKASSFTPEALRD